jgi:hypothetical protein
MNVREKEIVQILGLHIGSMLIIICTTILALGLLGSVLEIGQDGVPRWDNAFVHMCIWLNDITPPLTGFSYVMTIIVCFVLAMVLHEVASYKYKRIKTDPSDAAKENNEVRVEIVHNSKTHVNNDDPNNPIAVIVIDGIEYEHTLAHVTENKREWYLGVLDKQMNAIHYRSAVKTLKGCLESPDLEQSKIAKFKEECGSLETPFSTLKTVVAPTQVSN